MFRTMFYIKNVPVWERALRVIFGVVLVGYLIASQAALLVMVIGISSALFAVGTGFIGWCPMCAMVGRKISTQQGQKATSLEVQKR